MITSLKIQNFKSWENTGSIRLAPLTVFFGANSSGKSSINQLLLMLKQTALSPDRKRVLHFGDKNTDIDLGTFEEIVFGHKDRSILFQMDWELEEDLKVKDPLTQKTYEGKMISFSSEVKSLEKPRQRLIVNKMGYRLGSVSDRGLEIEMQFNENGKKGYDLKWDGYNLVRNPGRVWPIPAPTRFYGFPDEVIAYFQNAHFVQDLILKLENRLKSIHYLGPLREYPQRSYTWSGEVPEHVGWRGERAVDAILASKDRKISLGLKKKSKIFGEMIAFWLKEMGLITSFEVKQISKNRREYEVLVKTPNIDELVNITDVGFGVSQVLPVLVECFYCPENSTIILEQPEIHLHPSVQASLADLFIASIQSRENGKDRKVQLIVESHSEHFLRRLQRRIAEKQLSVDETAIYFCQSSASGSIIQELDIDLFGEIKNWPENFFGDEMSDLVAMTEASERG